MAVDSSSAPSAPLQTGFPFFAPKSWSNADSMQRSTVVTAVLAVIVSLLVLEQVVYRHKKGSLPGAKWTIPVIGKFADSLNPTIQNYQKSWEQPLFAVSVFNIFIVIASSVDYTRRILHASSHAEPCLTASAKKVLLPDNWVFLNGKAHTEYRRGLNVLFTRTALSSYMPTLEAVFRNYFAKWLADTDGPKPYAMEFRDLNMEVSLKIFCGNYIDDEAGKLIAKKYFLISTALELVNFPLALPGTKIYGAIQARKLAMKWFEKTAAESKIAMAAGKEPHCLVDRWVKAMIDARAYEAAKKGGKESGSDSYMSSESRAALIREFSDKEIAMAVMSFLFASQDAMSSGLTFAFQLLADNPEIREKVREEQHRLREDADTPLTLELIDEMTYTKAVVKETLRFRPPVIMVPYLTKKAFPINDQYTAPAGSMIIPSMWPALHDPQVYPEPDTFMPERWLEGGNAYESDPKNFLVYGAGAHRCIGQEYSNIQLAAVIGTASMMMDWIHVKTDSSEDFSMLPTIFPKDECILKFTPRIIKE